jgi:hypothetical protein
VEECPAGDTAQRRSSPRHRTGGSTLGSRATRRAGPLIAAGRRSSAGVSRRTAERSLERRNRPPRRSRQLDWADRRRRSAPLALGPTLRLELVPSSPRASRRHRCGARPWGRASAASRPHRRGAMTVVVPQGPNDRCFVLGVDPGSRGRHAAKSARQLDWADGRWRSAPLALGPRLRLELVPSFPMASRRHCSGTRPWGGGCAASRPHRRGAMTVVVPQGLTTVDSFSGSIRDHEVPRSEVSCSAPPT